MAIVDAGINFGGGMLGRYGINSNTSGGGFLKCTYKKVKKEKEETEPRPVEKPGARKKGSAPKPAKRPEGGLSNPYA